MIAGLAIAVIDDEVDILIKLIVAGCDVNEESLAYDVMKEVIPRDGVFLGEMHTVRQMRQGALWIPKLETWPKSWPSRSLCGTLLWTSAKE